MILFNGFEIELKKSDFMDKDTNYARMITDILPELFHSHYFSYRPEQERHCPICNSEEEFGEHEDLAKHVVDTHPHLLAEYAESLSYMFKHPLDYFIFDDEEINWRICNVCGTNITYNFTDAEAKRHILSHKEYFDDIINWLRERAK